MPMPKSERGGVGGLVGRVYLRPPHERELTQRSWCHLPVTNQAASIFWLLASTHSGSRFQPLTGACTIKKQQFRFSAQRPPLPNTHRCYNFTQGKSLLITLKMQQSKCL